MGRKESIKDFYGRILGYIETLDNGDQVATDFYGRVLGKYYAHDNVTKDFYGRILAHGNILASLIYNK